MPLPARLLSLAAVLVVSACASDSLSPGPTDPVLEVVIGDMTRPHEGRPRGVPADGGPAWSWTRRPRVGYGDAMPRGWSGFVAWGQVYVDDSGRDPAPNTRVQVRRIEAYLLHRGTGRWRPLTGGEPITGANYAEDFADDANVPADLRDESARGGGVSATVPDGTNFHFFPDRRARLDPADVAGIWTRFEARLVLGDPAGPDDRADSPLIASAGADYWASPTAPWDQWTTNGDVGIGRFKYVTADWQTFNMHTLTEAEMRATPVPTE